jgi:predicted PurR-regulated permease PerM
MCDNKPTSPDVAFVHRVLIVVAIGAVVLAVWALSDVLLLLFGSVLVAVLLRTIADPLARSLGIADRWALALAGLLVIGILAAGIWFLGPELARQMRNVFDRLPAAFAKIADALELGSFSDLLKGAAAASSLGSLASRFFSWSTTILGALASLGLVVFGGIYLAADPKLYRQGFVKLVPPAIHPNVDAALDDIGTALRRWLTGQVMAMALVGFLTGAGLWLVGVPSPFALGFIAGLAEFVPIVGPIVAAVPTLLIASGQDWQTALLAMGVLVLVQQLESNLITPLIADKMVSVAPVVGLFAVVAMGVLFGPLGLLFGFPLAVALDVAVRRFYVHDALGEPVEIGGEPAKPTQRGKATV